MTVRLREDIEALKAATGTGSGSLGAKITALETAVGGADSGLVKDVTALKTAVGDSNSGAVKDIATLKNLISDDGETKMLFGMVVTIDDSTGAVSLTAPASEG